MYGMSSVQTMLITTPNPRYERAMVPTIKYPFIKLVLDLLPIYLPHCIFKFVYAMSSIKLLEFKIGTLYSVMTPFKFSQFALCRPLSN